MKNYQKSDYALNKMNQDAIVYRFADGTIKNYTLEDYLADYPGKAEADFRALKELSDADYLERDRKENAQTKKNKSIHIMEDVADFGGATLEDDYLGAMDKQEAARALDALLAGGKLTEAQRRRFLMHINKGLSLREIAEREGVALRAVQQSIYSAADKLKKYFKFF